MFKLFSFSILAIAGKDVIGVGAADLAFLQKQWVGKIIPGSAYKDTKRIGHLAKEKSFKVKEFLGRGAGGMAFSAKDSSNNKDVVIKVPVNSSPTSCKTIENEFDNHQVFLSKLAEKKK